jgi:hypothetical protein
VRASGDASTLDRGGIPAYPSSPRRPGVGAARPARPRLVMLGASLARHPRGLHRGRHAGTRLHNRYAGRPIRAGLATAKAERVVAGGKTIEVARVRITEAERRVLAPEGAMSPRPQAASRTAVLIIFSGAAACAP